MGVFYGKKLGKNTLQYGSNSSVVLSTRVMFSRMTNRDYLQPKSPYKAYNGEYALCTTAKCVPLQNGTLSCSCDVRNGNAVGIKTTNSLKPFTLGGKNFVYSLYSGVNGSEITKQTCNSGGTWGDCLNQICVKTSSITATCFCKPEKTNPWITFQYTTNTAPCSCNNLSGALNNAYVNINDFYNGLK